MPVTIKQALAQADQLRSVSDSWRLDAELLLAQVLCTSREYLYTWPTRELAADQLAAYGDCLHRRQSGEPIAYILGKQAFWDFELKVNPSVLIPRPETELLLETALEILGRQSETSLHILDLGTGSGAIALALARSNRDWRLTAVDVSDDALALAKENAQALAVTNIEFRQSSWCEGLEPFGYDMIVSNPPYVAEGDRHLQEGDLRFEPALALVSSEQGLSDIRQIANQSSSFLKKDAWLLLEHGYEQKQDVARLLKDAGFSNIACSQDLAGMDRLTRAQRA